jgi:chromosome segregation ATPase
MRDRILAGAAIGAMDFHPLAAHTYFMNALLFDTLRLSRTLRDKGRFTSEQAETLAEALGEAVQGELATKADLGAITTDISAVRADLGGVKTELAGVKTELAGVKTDLAGVKTDLAGVKAELKSVKADVADVKVEVSAIKADLATVKTDVITVKADLATVRAELKSSIAETKADILKWVVGAIGFQTVLILGALVSLTRVFAK